LPSYAGLRVAAVWLLCGCRMAPLSCPTQMYGKRMAGGKRLLYAYVSGPAADT